MLERRTLLAGLAALPAAGLPLAAAAASRPDPFAAYHGEVLAVQAVIDDPGAEMPEDEVNRLMDRWGGIDAQAMAGQPTTLAGALGALQMARREFVQFQMDAVEDEGDPSKRLVLHLIDGAIGVLRRAGAGGVA